MFQPNLGWFMHCALFQLISSAVFCGGVQAACFPELRRRMDLILSRREHLPLVLLNWTGSGLFLRELHRLASYKGADGVGLTGCLFLLWLFNTVYTVHTLVQSNIPCWSYSQLLAYCWLCFIFIFWFEGTWRCGYFHFSQTTNPFLRPLRPLRPCSSGLKISSTQLLARDASGNGVQGWIAEAERNALDLVPDWLYRIISYYAILCIYIYYNITY